MKIDDLRERLNKIFILMPPETHVQYYIDNDLLPSEKDMVPVSNQHGKHAKPRDTTTAGWSKENPYKVCSICNENLHITKYYVRRTRTEQYGYLCILSMCKVCSVGPTTNPPRMKVWIGNAEIRGKKAKEAIMNFFDDKCKRCGYEGQAAQMDLDHINPKEKGWCLAAGNLAHSTPEEIIEEVLKCQMVCANCHRLISTKAKYQKETLTYFPVGAELYGSKGILERMSAPAPDREHLRLDS